MQSGKIKHWNSDKGYGFIDVDNQSEDVFFHIKSVRMAQPISEGQRVYFNSERNDKNQLRATEVTSDELSILETPASIQWQIQCIAAQIMLIRKTIKTTLAKIIVAAKIRKAASLPCSV